MKTPELPRIPVYVTGHRPPDVYPRQYIPIFGELETAHLFIDRMINRKNFTFDGKETITLAHPEFEIKIKASKMKAILEAPVATILRSDIVQHTLRFKYGTWEEIHEAPKAEAEATIEGRIEDTPGVKLKTPKATANAKASIPEGYVTITELCATWNVLPRIARAALRGSGRDKPAFGWAFAPGDVEAIKKLVVSSG